MNTARDIIFYINSFASYEPLFAWKIASIFVGTVFLVFIIVILFRTSWIKFQLLFDLTEFLTYKPLGVPNLTRQWQRIRSMLRSANEGEYKLAIIEADGILGNTLTRLGFNQPTIAERLKQVSPAIIPNLDQIWEAHKVRNNIVHDPDYRLSLEEASKVLGYYEETFKSLDLIS
ncbi:MAG: hypothetical protein Q7S63_02705 [bacterium]|nr:hypothetical protein [bacterium]